MAILPNASAAAGAAARLAAASAIANQLAGGTSLVAQPGRVESPPATTSYRGTAPAATVARATPAPAAVVVNRPPSTRASSLAAMVSGPVAQPAQTPTQRFLQELALPWRPDYDQYNLSGFMGTPGTSFTQQAGPAFPDRQWASNVQTMVQQARPGDVIEPSSEAVLRYQAQQVINRTFPDMGAPGRPALSNSQLKGALDLARAQDYRPAPTKPPRPATPSNAIPAPDQPNIYAMDAWDSPEADIRNSSQFFGQMGSDRKTGDPPTTVDDALIQQAMSLDAEIASIQAYMQTADYFNNPNPYYQSVLNSKTSERDRLAAQINAAQDQLPNVPVFGPLVGWVNDALTTVSNAGPEDIGDARDAITGSVVWEAVRESPLIDNPIGNSILNRAQQLMAAAGGAAESVAKSGFVESAINGFVDAMEWYSNEIQQPIKRSTAELIYNYALNDPERSSLEANDFGSGLSLLFAMPVMVMIEIDDALGDDSVRQNIINAYESSTEPNQGVDATWEVIIGLADGAPWPIRYTWIAAGEILTDPASLAPWVGVGGKVARGGGRILSALPEASLAERVAGAALRGTGATAEIGATLLDTLGFEYLPRGVRWFGNKVGAENVHLPRPGQSIATSQSEAYRVTESARREFENASKRSGRPTAAAIPDPEDGSSPTGAARPDEGPSPNMRPEPNDRPGGTSVAEERGIATVTTADGQLVPSPSAVPADLPYLRRMLEVATQPNVRRGTVRAAGESVLSPRLGGFRPQDRLLDEGAEAILAGDMVTARQMNDALADMGRFVNSGVAGDRLFLNTREGGSYFNYRERGNGTIYPMTQEQSRLLASGPDGTSAYGMRNALTKQSFSDALEELLVANWAVNNWHKYLPASELPITADAVMRIGGDFMDERVGWLIREFVRTPDERRARAIMSVLSTRRPDGNWYGVDAAGHPYMKAIPDDLPSQTPGSNKLLRDEIHDMMRGARSAYQTALRNPAKPNYADQLGGGLAKSSQDAAEAIRAAELQEIEKLTEAAVDRAKVSVVGRIQWKLNPQADLNRYPTGAEMEIRREADGTFTVWNRNGDSNWEWRPYLPAETVPDPEQFMAEMLKRGDSQGSWATRLADDEDWDSPRVVEWRNTPDGGEASPENIQYLGDMNPITTLPPNTKRGGVPIAEAAPSPASAAPVSEPILATDELGPIFNPGAPTPTSVQRYTGKSGMNGDPNGPAGVYTTPSEVDSPYKTLFGGDRVEFEVNPNARVLRVENTGGYVEPPSGGITTNNAGMMTIRQLHGEDAMHSLITMTDDEIAAIVRSEIPGINLSGRSVESMIDAYAASLARKQGYDAIWMPGRGRISPPEFVGLTDNAFRSSAPSPASAAPVAEPTVRKVEGSRKWEVVDGDGNVIGTNPTKKDALTRARQWYESQGQSGIVPRGVARSMSFGERVRQGRLALTPSASVGPDPSTIRHADIRHVYEIGELNSRDAVFLDQVIEWTPPGWPKEFGRQPREFTVLDALEWADDERFINPKFDYDAEFQRIAELATGFNYDDFSRFAKAVDKFGKNRLVKAYDAFMNAVIRQHRRYGPLTGLRNIVGDTIGTDWQLIITGEGASVWDLMPWNVASDTRAYRKMGRDPHRIAESLDDSFVRATGQMIPYRLTPGVSRGEDAFGGLPSANQRAQSLGVARHTGNLWAVPYFKDYLNNIDIVSRTSVWKRSYQRAAREQGLPSFAKTLNEIAGDPNVARQWADLIEQEARRKAGGYYNGAFSPADVRNALKDVTKRNTDLARAWQGQLVKASDAALKRTEDVLFTYKNTNLDELARRVFVFHYWQTRAYPLHIRAALRNPVLINGYYKMWAELEQLAEEQNISPYLQGMFRFFQSPDGISAFFSPVDLLVPTTILDMNSEKGQRWQVLIQQMSPFLIAGTAMLGGDMTPDMIATRNDENFMRRFLNYMTGQGVDVSQIPIVGQFFDPNTMQFTIPTEEFYQHLIGITNRMLEAAGVPVGEYQPFERGNNELEQLRTWVGYHAEQAFGPMFDDAGNYLWTPDQTAMYGAALTGIQSGLTGNPLLDAANESYGNEEGLAAALSLIVPAGAVVNSQFRTDMLRKKNEYINQQYKGTGEQRSAFEMSQDTRAADPAWSIANRAYHELGTQESREAYALMNTMIYNPEDLRHRSIVVLRDGRYVEQELAFLVNMTEDERRAWAEGWLAEQGFAEGVAQLQAERDAFKAANPEYAQYTEYQSAVYRHEDKPGGIKAWREGLAADNPNFAAAMEAKREQLVRDGTNTWMIETELDQWAAGQQAYFAMIGEPYKVGDTILPVYDPKRDASQSDYYDAVMGNRTTEGTGGGQYTQESSPDEPEKYTPEWFQQNAQEQAAHFSFENLAAEQLYGDNWDFNAVAQSGDAYDGYTGPNKKGFRTEYYPGAGADTNPSADVLEKRYQEWARWMKLTNPYADLSYEAWLAWEAGIWDQVSRMSGYEIPEQWLPYLED